MGDQVVAEELHERSPATRPYNQPQIEALLKRVGFRDVWLYGQFTFDPVKPEDAIFVVLGQKPGEVSSQPNLE